MAQGGLLEPDENIEQLEEVDDTEKVKTKEETEDVEHNKWVKESKRQLTSHIHNDVVDETHRLHKIDIYNIFSNKFRINIWTIDNDKGPIIDISFLAETDPETSNITKGYVYKKKKKKNAK